MTPWIEAMRLRTLPVSVAGVFAACGYALADGCFEWLPATLCLVFAVLAQIASNFGNEYFDFRAGLDKPGRVGPRRGVTEGDITPRAMLIATLVTLALACAVGLWLVAWGGWWLVAVGIAVVLGVLAYSTGPWPLSRHGMGEIAVIIFFGIVPVNLTYWLQAGEWSAAVFAGSLAIGLMGANVIIINNYRDVDADRDVHKHTLAVLVGAETTRLLYLLNGLLAAILVAYSYAWSTAADIIAAAYIAAHIVLWRAIGRRTGSALTPLLGMTAVLMLAVSLALLAAS